MACSVNGAVNESKRRPGQAAPVRKPTDQVHAGWLSDKSGVQLEVRRAAGGIGFLASWTLGPNTNNDLFAGAATPLALGGYLFRFNLTGQRQQVVVAAPRLEDRVADNNAKHDLTENESLLFAAA